MNPTKIIAHLAIIAVTMRSLAEAGNIYQHAPQTNVSSDDAFVTPIPADNTPIATPVPTTPAPSVTDAPEATPAPTTPAPSVTDAPEATPIPTAATPQPTPCATPTPKPTPCATPTPKPTPCATPAPTTAGASATPLPTKPSDEAIEKSEKGNKSPATNPKNGPSSDHEDRSATATAETHNDGQRVSSSANTGSVVSGASAAAGYPARAGVGANAGLNAGAGLGANAGLRAGAGLGVNAGLGMGAGLGANAGLVAGAGLGENAGLGAGAGLGANAGLNAGAGLGANAGLRAGAGLGANAGVGETVGGAANGGVSASARVGGRATRSVCLSKNVNDLDVIIEYISRVNLSMEALDVNALPLTVPVVMASSFGAYTQTRNFFC
ncbi:hypothetical protein PR003_g3771 [Phytophthora rubi]|uniref:RxLR effector protein n=1 Tax=Phytophthora rubi TaxID=129364 RepID=A0A6A3LM30_9STRA|nr:hypothetical protein PR002_g12928 [Phytophthora rubi]KAE9049006.1 hypothetical protein PR001_g3620 [Phytophthora rubi]KAE9353619.1 hypothetical protein PR003_g3771 [Phytophthora rubi]